MTNPRSWAGVVALVFVAAAPAFGQEPSAAAGRVKVASGSAFVVRDNKAEFVPIKTGIAGDKYFEVLSGLKEGDQVITGPFSSVRDLTDGSAVKIEAPASKRST